MSPISAPEALTLPMTDEDIRSIADAILRAGGSGGLGYYTPRNRDKIIEAARVAIAEIQRSMDTPPPAPGDRQ